jgi:hypothetical protein
LKLDKLIKDSKLVERLDKLDPDTASGARNDGINYWRGKKIITLAEWNRKIGRNGKALLKDIEDHRIKEALQYFPDNYEDSLFPMNISKELMGVANKWYNQYIELMKFRNNSKCGRWICSDCLLCPDNENNGKNVGISKFIANAIEGDADEEEEEEGEYNNSNFDTPTTIESLYPCSVLNRFKCPYEREDRRKKQKYQQQSSKGEEEEEDLDSFDVDYLFKLASVSSAVESALIIARKENSLVPIKNVVDIYNALTDRERFDKLLQQGLDEEHLKYKDGVVEFFMSIKDKVRIEDLTFFNPTNT